MSSVIRKFHASKGVEAFLPWLITPCNFVRVLHRTCVKLLTLSYFLFSFPMNTFFSSVHLSAAIFIQRCVLCILRVIFCRFHIIFIGLLPDINAINNKYIIKHIIAPIRSASSAFFRDMRSKTAARN